VRIANVNEGQEDEIYVIDDFLRDAEPMRRLGLQADYPVPLETPWYPGRNSSRPFPIAGLDQMIGHITGRAVAPLADSAHTKFRVCSRTKSARAAFTSTIATGPASIA
jgi:hypothetical protein